MIKIDLARTISERLDITQKDADEFLTVFMEVVGETLEKGEKLQLAGFGVFDVRYVPEHQGRNPKTGEVLAVPACHYPIFKAGKGLKDRVADFKKTVDESSVNNETEAVKDGTSSLATKTARKKQTNTTSNKLT